MNDFYHGVIRFRWWIIALTIPLVLVAASGGRFIEFSASYRNFFSAENPQLRAFDELQNTYSKNDNVQFVVAPKDGKVFTRDTLAAIQWLTKEGWQMPYSRRVDSVTNFQHTSANGDDLVVRDLVEDPSALSDADLQHIEQIALNEPLLLNRLVSSRAHVTGVNVTVVLPEKKLDEVPEVMTFARQLAAQAERNYPQLDIHLTGMVPYNYAFAEYSQKDLATLVPVMYAIIIIVCLISLRSISGTVATVLVILFSVMTAMGMMGWLGIKLTGPSSAAPTIILTVAVADSIHILSNMLTFMRGGMSKNDAIVESLRMNMNPVFLTSITTVFGFLTMNFSEVPPFRDLGNVTSIGVLAAWAYSIVFLPALMAVLPVHVNPARALTSRTMERLGDFVVARHRPLFWGTVALALGLMAFIPRNELNDDFVKYFDKSVDFRNATDFMVENLTGVNLISYSLGAGESGGVSNPAYLNKLEEFSQWYRGQPGVVHVSTVTDIMKRLNKNMHGDDAAFYRVPDERELSAQYLLLYEMSLPFGLDLNDQINVDKSASRMMVTLGHATTKEILALEKHAHEWLQANAPADMFNYGTGPTIMFAHIGERNIKAMINGNLVALILVSIPIMWAIRHFKIGLVTLIPNLLPIGMGFGLWGLLVGQVGLSLSVVTSLTFGIVVDDTIHFITKYMYARRKKNHSPQDAVRYAFNTVGTAMWFTSVILVAGFMVLTLSAFELNKGMGQLSAITIALALLGDFFLLPALLIKLETKKNEKPVADNDNDVDPDAVRVPA